MNKRWGAFLLTIPISAVGLSGALVEAHADSYYEGADSCGVVVKEKSPIEIEREKITLHISDFPDPTSDMVCPSFVSVAYTFYNPTEEDETLRLYLPEGDPCYFGSYAGGAQLAPIEADCEGEMTVSLRHTFRSGSSFDAEEEVGRIEDGKRSDAFFTPEMSVEKRVYSIARPKTRDRDYANLILKYNPARTRIFFDNRCGGAKTAVEDGFVRLTWETTLTNCSIEVCVLGEPAETVDAFMSSDPEGKKRVGDAAFSLADGERLPFAAYASSLLPAEGVGEDDWYNALVDLLNERCNKFGAIYVPCAWFTKSLLRTWYAYELCVPSKTRVTNTVCSPLLPTVDMSGPLYRYGFLLSPAHKFAAIKALEIHIETPYYLGYSNLAFEKEEGGYYFSREELPIGELTFTLAQSEETYKSVGSGSGGKLSPSTRLAIILLSVLGTGAAVALAAASIAVIRRKKHRTQR